MTMIESNESDATGEEESKSASLSTGQSSRIDIATPPIQRSHEISLQSKWFPCKSRSMNPNDHKQL